MEPGRRWVYDEVIDFLTRLYDVVENEEYSAYVDAVDDCLNYVKRLSEGSTVDELIAERSETYRR